jgi:glutamine synthetase
MGPAELAREAAAALTLRGVRAIALTYVDNAGITRVKAVPTTRFDNAVTVVDGMSPLFDVYTF